MVCFWKWGHKWRKASEKEAKQIEERLALFGIYVEHIEICTKCRKVKLVASTFMDYKPKTKILPPFPFKNP